MTGLAVVERSGKLKSNFVHPQFPSHYNYFYCLLYLRFFKISTRNSRKVNLYQQKNMTLHYDLSYILN